MQVPFLYSPSYARLTGYDHIAGEYHDLTMTAQQDHLVGMNMAESAKGASSDMATAPSYIRSHTGSPAVYTGTIA